MQDEKNKEKTSWYYRTKALVVAFLCVGPLALPLLWFNPRYSLKLKIVVSIVVIILTVLLIKWSADALKSMNALLEQGL
jgi:hypothetical protein